MLTVPSAILDCQIVPGRAANTAIDKRDSLVLKQFAWLIRTRRRANIAATFRCRQRWLSKSLTAIGLATYSCLVVWTSALTGRHPLVRLRGSNAFSHVFETPNFFVNLRPSKLRAQRSAPTQTSVISKRTHVRIGRIAKLQRTVGSSASSSHSRNLTGIPVDLQSAEAKLVLASIGEAQEDFDFMMNSMLQKLLRLAGKRSHQEAHRLASVNSYDWRKEKNCHIVAELLYLRVVQSFQARNIPFTHERFGGTESGFGTVNPQRFVYCLYSAEATELIKEHVLAIIGEWEHLDRNFPLRLAMLQLSQIYLFSALFGYYLRRVDLRYQLEKIAGSFDAIRSILPSVVRSAEDDFCSSDDGCTVTHKVLEHYIAAFGPEGIFQASKAASNEAQLTLDLQVSALFGSPSELRRDLVQALGKLRYEEEPTDALHRAICTGQVPSVVLTVSGLRQLTLEALAFGTLLGAAEEEVDSLYTLNRDSRGPLAQLLDEESWNDGASFSGLTSSVLHLSRIGFCPGGAGGKAISNDGSC